MDNDLKEIPTPNPMKSNQKQHILTRAVYNKLNFKCLRDLV